MSASHQFGPFLLEGRIAVGGTAEVYLARPAAPDTGLPDKLVVKRLLPHFASDPDGRTMFEREARLHAAVSHENVVTVFHAGTDQSGEPYLAMELIDGVDGYRLLRRLRQDGELLPVGVSIYIAREVLRALESVHAAKDPLSGGSLGIVHRDVSPSNIYLSKNGTVKLGDFGIARSTSRTSLRSEQGQVLKGKFAYLAPEQVAGEPSDHRADLFSLATVLAEMFLNRPLFPGGGQLAILLAIRDCKVDALFEIKDRLPPGLFDVMKKALARDPNSRYPNASALAEALRPFEADKRLAVREIAARVRWVQSSQSTDQLAAIRDSQKMRTVKLPVPEVPPPRPKLPSEADVPIEFEEEAGFEPKTSEYEALPSYIERNGQRIGPYTFARLMEALATGHIQRDDRIDFLGRGYQRADAIEELSRFFPAPSATTGQLTGPGAPDFRDAIGSASILDTLMRILADRETGVLFAERDDESGEGRKELYFAAGKLHHVASSDASELLGEYLVRRGKLERTELDLALAVLPRYGGRMGDTLISMGLVGPVDVFRAIRDQGRDRVADLFSWRGGTVTFYRGEAAPHVEFPLDLDLPPLMLAGLEASQPGELPVEQYRARFDKVLAVRASERRFDGVAWPAPAPAVFEVLLAPTKLRDLLKKMVRPNEHSAGDVLRAVELLLAAQMIGWQV